jgi:nucleoside-triphosphatase THEP1
MVTLTAQQQTILEQFLEEFRKRKLNEESMLYQINGPAGTGKTELTRYIIDVLFDEDYSVMVCSMTNKACQVLQERLRDFCVPITTCHQFLGGKPIYNTKGESKWRFKTETIELPDLLIIDEVSMISSEVYQQIKWLLQSKNACILTLGDRCQLPPVLEDETLFYSNHSVQGTLTQNMRNEKQEYNKFLTRLRYFIESPKQIPKFNTRQLLEWLSNYTKVYTLQFGSFDFDCLPREIIRSFSNGSSSVLLAHRTNPRNNTVQKLNFYIRNQIFKEKASETFTENEQVIFTDYYSTEEEQVFHTNDRAIVRCIFTAKRKFYDKEFLVYDLELDYNETNVHVYYIHKSEYESFSEYQKQVRKEIEDQIDRIESLCKSECNGRCHTHRKEIDELWKVYHEAKKNICCPIDYAYCLSIHKSQGSTYNNVYLFLSDFIWMLNNKSSLIEFFKLLYVGMSRSKNETVVF